MSANKNRIILRYKLDEVGYDKEVVLDVLRAELKLMVINCEVDGSTSLADIYGTKSELKVSVDFNNERSLVRFFKYYKHFLDVLDNIVLDLGQVLERPDRRVEYGVAYYLMLTEQGHERIELLHKLISVYYSNSANDIFCDGIDIKALL